MAIEQRLDEAQELVRAHQQLNDYLSRGNLLPQNSALGLLNETNSFLRENPNLFPKDPEESLYVEEARRRLGVHSRSLELRLTGKPITMSEITTLYGIEVQDLSTIEPWLVDPENKTRISCFGSVQLSWVGRSLFFLCAEGAAYCPSKVIPARYILLKKKCLY